MIADKDSHARRDAVAPPKVEEVDRGTDFLKRALDISKIVESEADAAERMTTITQPVYQALADTELFWMLVPKQFGGGGIGVKAAIEVVEEISRADGSTGWAFMANSFSTGMAGAYLPEAGARAMFCGPEKGITCGMLSPVGKAVEVEGGVKGGGRFRFGSGSAHATWIGGGVIVQENGKPRLNESGEPTLLVIIVPKGKYTLLGNWDVMGLVATGSYDYEIPDQFISSEFTYDGIACPEPKRGRPLFHLGAYGLGCAGHSGIVLGVMKRALQEVAQIVHNKGRLGYPGSVHEYPVFKHQFATHEASYWAARAYVMQAFGDAEATAAAGMPIEVVQRARLRQATSWAHKIAQEVISFCHHWGGTQSFRNPSALGRCTRDLSVIIEHLVVDPISFVDAAEPIYQSWLRKHN